MRARTSASQARGSTSFSFADAARAANAASVLSSMRPYQPYAVPYTPLSVPFQKTTNTNCQSMGNGMLQLRQQLSARCWRRAARQSFDFINVTTQKWSVARRLKWACTSSCNCYFDPGGTAAGSPASSRKRRGRAHPSHKSQPPRCPIFAHAGQLPIHRGQRQD
jgi:hypothetical protein